MKICKLRFSFMFVKITHIMSVFLKTGVSFFGLFFIFIKGFNNIMVYLNRHFISFYRIKAQNTNIVEYIYRRKFLIFIFSPAIMHPLISFQIWSIIITCIVKTFSNIGVLFPARKETFSYKRIFITFQNSRRSEISPVDNHNRTLFELLQKITNFIKTIRTDKLVNINKTYPLCFILKFFNTIPISRHLPLHYRPVNQSDKT